VEVIPKWNLGTRKNHFQLNTGSYMIDILSTIFTWLGRGVIDLIKFLWKKHKDDENTQKKQYDIFLSYAKPDIEPTRKLAEHLKQAGVQVWFDEWVVKGGDRKASKPREGVKASRRIVAVLTPHYFASKSLDNFTMVVEALSQTQASLDKERPLIPALFENCEIPVIFQQFTPIDFTSAANFEWCVRQLLEALNFPRQQFAPKQVDKLPDYGVDDLRERKPRGENFVDAAAKVYRLQHFEVQLDYEWQGVTFDLMVAKNDFGMRRQAVVTCLDVYCDLVQCHDIVNNKYQKVYQQLSHQQWIVLTAAGFSQDSFNHLNNLGISCITYAELLNQLVPLQDYVEGFITQYKRDIVDKIWAGNDWFIPPDIETDIERKVLPALDHVAHWMGKGGENLMTILGDLGTGKTTLANYLAYQWARAFQDNQAHHPAPVLVPLRDVRKAITLESIIISHLNQSGLSNVSFAHFEFLLRLGKVILLFDGFDEMADRIRYDTMRDNFRELARAAEHRSKVILTCRTQYFKNREEQVKTIGRGVTFKEVETPLFEDQRQYGGTRQQVVYLQLFDDEKIKAYLQRTRPEHWEADWDKVQSIYDMRGLAERPLLLDMIVKTLPQFDKSQHITVAKLYEHYTNQWVAREETKKRLLDPKSRLQLMLELAWQMWDRQQNAFAYRELLPFVEGLVTDQVMDFDEESLVLITREMQTATFLKRETDHFRFMHRSFMEYFLAYKIHAHLKKSDVSVLNTRRLDRKVVYFFTQLDQEKQCQVLLAQLLTGDYQAQISENALQVWYWCQRINAGMEEKITDMAALQRVLQFPSGVQLQNAQLAEIILEAATLPEAQLSGADLSKANLNNSDFHGSDLRQADLSEAKCLKGNFLDCDFTDAKLQDIDFKGSILPADLRKDLKVNDYPARERLFAVVQRGHPSWVNAVAYSPDGEQFATGCNDGVIRLWHSSDYRLLRTLEGHQDGVRSVAFDPSGQRLASGSDDQTVRLWHPNDGQLLHTLEGHTGSVQSVAFDPSGQRLASGSSDKTVRLWHPNDGQLLHTLEGHTNSVQSVAFDPSGQRLASGSYDKTVRLWHPNSGKLLHTLEGHTEMVRSVAFDPSGQRLASGRLDKTVRLWHPNEGQLLHTLEGHQLGVLSVAFDPSGQRLASGSLDDTVRLWDPNSGQLLHTLEGHQSGVLSVAFDPSGQRLASGSLDQTVRLWHPNSGQLLHTLEGHRSGVQSVAFDPSGQRLASGSYDKTVRLWHPNDGQMLHTLEGHKGWVQSVAFDPSGQRLASGSSDKTVRLWDPNDGQLLHTLEGHQSGVRSVAFDPSGQRLVSGSDDNTVRLWDPNAGCLLHTLKGHRNSVKSVAFDPSGQRLASGSSDNTVRLWNSQTGECLAILTNHLGEVYSVAFAPNGRYLVAAGEAGRLQFWDLATYQTFLYLYSFGAGAWLALLPDGRFNANPEGMRYLCYTETGTLNSYRAEELVEEFYDPEGVKGVLAGYRV
jgi:WD40 repeat protein